MDSLKKLLFYIGLLLFTLTNVNAQKSSKINVEYSDFADINQTEIPDALLLSGHVRVSHEGVVFTCNKAYFFQKENYIKAFGEVQMIQGDTLFLNSKYAEYNGEVKKAYATGNVIMRSPESTLVTDTINFDRNTQEAFYNSYGKITNKENTLKSKSGRYFANEKKFKFLTTVTITNPKYLIYLVRQPSLVKRISYTLKKDFTIPKRISPISNESPTSNTKIERLKQTVYIMTEIENTHQELTM